MNVDTSHKSYESLDTLGAREALDAHYDFANGIYKLWARPRSVVSAIALGWKHTHHPAQLHYGWDLEAQPHLDAAIELTTNIAYGALDAPSSSDARVLEPGCGIGGAVTQLARRNGNVHFIGASIVRKQQHIARARADRLNLPNTSFMQANYLELPLRDASIDGVYAIEALCYTPPHQRSRMLTELARVLKPGAKLSILDGYTIRQPRTPHEARAQQDVLDGWTLPLPTHPHRFIELANQAGFEVEQASDVTAHIYASAHRINAIGRWALRPLTQLARLPGGALMLRPIGFGSPVAAARFAAACVSQVSLFDSGIGQYWHHVFRRVF